MNARYVDSLLFSAESRDDEIFPPSCQIFVPSFYVQKMK
jgi:hypothetical protein